MGRFNFKDQEDLESVKKRAEVFYQTIGTIRCPYFAADVAFNAKGLRHLKFKSDQVARLRSDQYVRLKLIYLAPKVLNKSHTVQGIWNTKRFEEQNINSRWERMMKEVIFYEFIAVLENVRVKVIVKEVTGGGKHFWSIIPYWDIDAGNSRRILHSGNPELD